MKTVIKLFKRLFFVEELTFTEVRLRLARFFEQDSILRDAYKYEIREILKYNGVKDSSVRVKASEEILNTFMKGTKI